MKPTRTTLQTSPKIPRKPTIHNVHLSHPPPKKTKKSAAYLFLTTFISQKTHPTKKSEYNPTSETISPIFTTPFYAQDILESVSRSLRRIQYYTPKGCPLWNDLLHSTSATLYGMSNLKVHLQPRLRVDCYSRVLRPRALISANQDTATHSFHPPSSRIKNLHGSFLRETPGIPCNQPI